MHKYQVLSKANNLPWHVSELSSPRLRKTVASSDSLAGRIRRQGRMDRLITLLLLQPAPTAERYHPRCLLIMLHLRSVALYWMDETACSRLLSISVADVVLRFPRLKSNQPSESDKNRAESGTNNGPCGSQSTSFGCCGRIW
jgi:hypothetical protein